MPTIEMRVYIAVSTVASMTLTEVRAVYTFDMPLLKESGSITVVRFVVSFEKVAQNTFQIGKMQPKAQSRPSREKMIPSAFPMFLPFRISAPP